LHEPPERRIAVKADLPARFSANLDALGIHTPRMHLLVALSGGCDSVTLLHLLRLHLAGSSGPRISAAHFDHGMRPDSEADARWVRGLCRAWSVPLVLCRSEEPLRSETAARRARYRFLRAAAREVGATAIVTAHHADDQAETVLFRALRGTGLRGLGGIRPRSSPDLVRPMLPFWRADVERFARSAGLRWRLDPTNRVLGPARNRIRNVILPELERTVAPGARRSLVRLAELARESEAAWAAVEAPLLARVILGSDGDLRLARAPFREYDPALGARLVRAALARLGARPSRAGTRLALQFITDAHSGRKLEISGGYRILSEFDEVRVERTAAAPEDAELEIASADPAGAGTVRLAGHEFSVRWEVGPAAGGSAGEAASRAVFGVRSTAFPLRVRGWRPGDRIRLAFGTKRLKKLFGERRVPVSGRAAVPVLVDAEGAVLWVPGLARADVPVPPAGPDAFHLTIIHG
jgi:tRNA(Ile)-lysidine synthase